MGTVSYQVKKTRMLLEQRLAIPSYQRPYKWQQKHVNQLIDDVLTHRNKQSYRLGTVVLHRDKLKPAYAGELDIVDGQQRLLTLTLLCSVLDQSGEFSTPLLEQSFASRVSINNLEHNAKVIENRLVGLNDNERKALLHFVCDKCELIEVTLDDLSEAFQFFDSQNARGKALAPHDLLKAYHLREMMDDTEQAERLHHVSLWEQGVSPDDESANLHLIMGEYLFRLRRWLDGDYGVQFSRHNLEVFKGVNLSTSDYHYLQSLLALDFAVEHYNNDPIRKWDKQNKPYPFQVNQLIINGKRFFEYIQHYKSLHHTLFEGDNALLGNFLKKHTRYAGSSRKGDMYIKNLFMCAVMAYYDKFGDKELIQAATICFCWSYYLRLQYQKIGMDSVDGYAREPRGLLRVLDKAIHPQQVLRFQPKRCINIRFQNAKPVEDSIAQMLGDVDADE
ncbi:MULTISPECIES: DUF262 domain-containing protein [Enterobacteriaceae]|uniref:DUF262 domain-containing protein n=1 Tax=Citrobacter portucalensis TaxID=1639133 RepID=A0ABD5GWA0_9ENTR|nr:MULTISPECIES: DUF262 domain-containing protein [Enterobacteriaceae]EGS5521379.1 DUF262 domain-containing protein [Citrobacter freundii]MBJ8709309.1 DUF262 domain-containing protein [Citrobacter freundii]MBZ7127570.1 DUF262 domain-containing protein [Klebsiella grimontii]MCY3418778.1 DUF262 domain-containing protein [Citrobacter freundii]MDH1409547.1 DUF262 domain-containing protein [Citrobacter freundii]